MKNAVANISSLFNRFARANSGVAAVEFALTVPFLLLLYIGSIEASRAVTVDRHLNTVASSLGDLVARNEATLPIAELNDYFELAGLLMAPYSATSLKQVVTCVEVAADGTTTIVWSRGYNGGTPHAEDAAFTLPAAFAAVAVDTHVIVAEAELDYQPLTTYVYSGTFHLYKQQFFLPRFGELIQLQDA